MINKTIKILLSNMSIIINIKDHECEIDARRGSACIDCSECVTQFKEALIKVNHSCLGRFGNSQYPSITCDYCESRMDTVRQLQTLRTGLRPLYVKEDQDLQILRNALLYSYKGPYLSGLYVDHLCVADPQLKSDDGTKTVSDYLHCPVCVRMFKILMSSLSPSHNCVDHTCRICTFLLKSWSKLSIVSQICTKFILDEHYKEINQREKLVKNEVLKPSPTSYLPSEESKILISRDSFRCIRILDELIQARNKSLLPDLITNTPMIVVIEGPIGAGKSTLMDALISIDKKSSFMEFNQEPLDKWIDHHGTNLLQQFYDSPQENSFLLQNVVFLTKWNQRIASPRAPIRVYERSILSSFRCFLPALERTNLIKPHEARALKSWENFFNYRFSEHAKIDVLIYLKINPSKCIDRIRQRGRNEENSIALHYLFALHEQYQTWVEYMKKHTFTKVIEIDADLDIEYLKPAYESLYKELLSTASQRGNCRLYFNTYHFIL